MIHRTTRTARRNGLLGLAGSLAITVVAAVLLVAAVGCVNVNVDGKGFRIPWLHDRGRPDEGDDGGSERAPDETDTPSQLPIAGEPA